MKHPFLVVRVTITQQIQDMFIDGVRGIFIIVLALSEQSLDAVENILRVGLIEPIVVLIELLFESFLIAVRYGLHIFLIKER